MTLSDGSTALEIEEILNIPHGTIKTENKYIGKIRRNKIGFMNVRKEIL